LEPYVGMLLSVAPLDRAEVLAGGRLVGDRPVSWVTVIHWPAAEFARPGELVLTTGVGCSEAELAEFVTTLAARDIAALCISRPFDERIPDSVCAAAEAAGLPLLRLPWELCFTDVSRAVLDEVVASRYRAELDGPGGLQQSCNRALLEGDSFDGLAAELERCTGRPALIFDRGFRLVGHGPAGARAVDGRRLPALDDVAADPLRQDALIELLAAQRPQSFRDLPAPWIGPAWGLRACARGRALGFVQLLGEAQGDGAVPPPLEARALEVAAESVAIEMLRVHATADGAQSDILCDLLSGAEAHALADRARGQAMELEDPWELAVARQSPPILPALESLRQRARRAGLELVECTIGDATVLAAPAQGGSAARLHALIQQVGQQYADGTVAWGLAEGAAPLRDAPRMLAEAQRALRVARSFASEEPVADPRRLGPSMVLGALGDDDYAAGVAHALVAPLVAYDQRTGRNLLQTLEVFLDEKGNTSASARRLFLNRHSLLYRLRKIEELTDRSLESSQDRFLLELSLRLHHYATAHLDGDRRAIARPPRAAVAAHTSVDAVVAL
jgi:purine catabolism regulator